ncbi:MAG: ABC transporter substrate-binding protein [Clostridia bacterium]
MNKILNRVNKKILAGAIATVFTISMFACFTNAISSKYPIKVKDYSGSFITITKKPSAIVSLTLTTDEILVSLINTKRIKAIDIFAADPGISNIAAFAKKFPIKIDADLEKIISLKPDLVYLADWKEKAFVQQLRDAKIPVFVFKSPTNFSELFTAIKEIAFMNGIVGEGDKMVKGIKTRLNKLWSKSKLRSIPKNKRLTVLSYSFYGSTYAKGTSFDSLVNKAGLVNAASKAGLKGWPNLSKEAVIKMNPDIIILPSWSYDNSVNPKAYLNKFMKDSSFAGLKAVKNKRVYILTDRYMQSTSQYMINGAELLAKTAYPKLFK